MSVEDLNKNYALELSRLCLKVTSGECEYDEYSEYIADAAYSAAVDGFAEDAMEQLFQLARYYEKRRSQDIESIRDHADIALLAGEISLYVGEITEAISWYKQAAQIDENYDLPYHCLGSAYIELNEYKAACNAFEREIHISPGNYYTYLTLAGLYDDLNENKNVEVILKSLLERDTENIQALHNLILHYQNFHSELDIGLLRARIINANRSAVKLDLFIWTYHMLEDGNLDEALEYLEDLERDYPGISITPLLKGYIYGKQRLFIKRKQALLNFRKLNFGRLEFMKTKIEEFSKIFGESETGLIKKSLHL